MQKNRTSIGFILAALLIGAVVVFMFRDNERINWWEHYEEDRKDPYGTLVIQNLLENYFEEESFVLLKDSLNNVLPLNSTGLNYIFIGEATYLDSIDTETLLDFVAAGNNAFISSKTIPSDFFEYLYFEDCPGFFWDDYETFRDTVITLNFKHPNLRVDDAFELKFYLFKKVSDYDWAYIDSQILCEEDYTFVELGHLNYGTPNFVKTTYGEGAIYLHTTPLAFSNISLLEESGLEYANKVFSHLSPGTIYWDAFSRIPENVGRGRNEGGGQNLNRESPLKYILSQPSLAWAWYLLLSVGLLYVIFRGKRKQRIIPVLEKNTNTSLEFIGTIGRLYFLQNNHRKLALQKMKLFLGYVRERYYLSTKELDENFVNQLVAKSEVSKKVIDKILLYYKNIETSSFTSENILVDFHKEMEQFYKHCK
jgi:hypothetical protein